MPITYVLERNRTQLTINIAEQMSIDELNQSFDVIRTHSADGLSSLLIRRQNATADLSEDDELDFGTRIGKLLAEQNITVAIVKRQDPAHRVLINGVIFAKGVTLAEFEEESDARHWLISKTETDQTPKA